MHHFINSLGRKKTFKSTGLHGCNGLEDKVVLYNMCKNCCNSLFSNFVEIHDCPLLTYKFQMMQATVCQMCGNYIP